MATNLEVVLAYLKAIEDGAVGDALEPFLDKEVVQREYPNRLVANGATRLLTAVKEASVRGQKVVSSQRYLVRSSLVDGDRVALEVDWAGTLKVPVGIIPAGGELHASFGVFFTLKDGKILEQANYDCFEPF